MTKVTVRTFSMRNKGVLEEVSYECPILS